MVTEIKQNEFDEVIKQSDKVLIDCYAPWCGPCKMLSPIIDEIATELDTCIFYKLNIDEADEISEKYQIMSIPTILIFANGELKERLVGFRSKDELIEVIK